MNWKAVLAAFLMTCSTSALAEVCSGTYQDNQNIVKLAQVTKKTPLYNESTASGTCARTGSCGTKGFLIAGDPVAVTATRGGWACVMFTGVNGRATWNQAFPLSSLKFVAAGGTLEGSWEVEDQSLFIRRQGGRLMVRGWTQWPWSSTPDPAVQRRLKESGPNIGNVDTSVNLSRGATWARFVEGAGEYACQLQVRVLGPYLFASDNNQCGGVNATFSGLYRLTGKTVSEQDWRSAKAP